MKSGVLELGLTVRVGEVFGTLAVGQGKIDGGNLQDEDWFVGQVKFSDTDSVIKGDEIRYFMLDIGRNFFWGARGGVAGFVGYGEYHEVIDAFGVADRLAGGAQVIPTSVRVISNDAKWTFLRLGVNGRFKPWEPLTLLAEVAYLSTDLTNEDSHHLRNDLGPVPNIHMKGSGDGLMWQVEARYNVFKGATLSLAYRDWRLTADGTIRFGASNRSLPLNTFETTRSGARVGLSYRF